MYMLVITSYSIHYTKLYDIATSVLARVSPGNNSTDGHRHADFVMPLILLPHYLKLIALKLDFGEIV